jgi:hypothetical protein
MYRSVVVQEHPHRRTRLRMLLVLGLVLVFAAGLGLGSYESLRSLFTLQQENESLAADLAIKSVRLVELEQMSVNSSVQGDIKTSALEMVRKELADRQQTIAELEEGLHFYRSLMAPTELAQGLSIRGIDLVKSTVEGRYQFRLLVMQSVPKHQLLQGSLRIDLIGEQDGQEVRFKLSELSAQVPAPEIRLRFKYFQAIDGVLDLPVGFTPLRFEAIAKASKPRKAEVKKAFDWSVEEKLTYVGQ